VLLGQAIISAREMHPAEASVLIARVEAEGISRLDVGRGYFLRHRVEVEATAQQPSDHGKRTEAAEFRSDLQIILLRP
jgi:hypothetical protein